MVLENLGPAPIMLTAGDRSKLEMLPSEIRVLEAYGQIAIRNQDQIDATVAMEFKPKAK
jgi:hypothetical protein